MVLCFFARVCSFDALLMGTTTWSEVGYLTFLVTWLGTPPAPCFEGLPHWPKRLPQVKVAQPWPSQALTKLGTRGCAFLRGLLRFPPTERSWDLDHVWFHPERLVLAGRTAPWSDFLPEGVISQAGLTGGREPGLTGVSPGQASATPGKRVGKGGASGQAEVNATPATGSQEELKAFRRGLQARRVGKSKRERGSVARA